MRCLIALVCLFLAVQASQNLFEKVVSGELGRGVRLDSPVKDGKLIGCFARHNNVVYELHPHVNLTHASVSIFSQLCNLHLSDITFDRAGHWEITIYTSVSNSRSESPKNVTTIYSYNVKVTETVDNYKPESITTYEGNYVSVFFKTEFNGAINCSLSSPENKLYNITSDENNVNGMELYKKCGVRMPVNESSGGQWTLIQQSDEYKFKNLSFILEILPKENITQSHQFWTRGSPQKLTLKMNHMKYCYVEQPDGEVVMLTKYPYEYKIDVVRNIHAGIWKVLYGTTQDINLLEVHYNITVVDPRAIDVNVTYSDNDKSLHMLCKTGVATIDFCLFTRPDGSLINVLTDIGNIKYEYIGNGTHFKSQGQFAECGLKIREPTTEDYGSWKCTVGVETGTISALVLTKKFSQRQITSPSVSKSDIYVKRGDNFTIKCTTNVALEYCWLRSPNRTIYSVTKNGNLPNSLPYDGEGLGIGVCGASIKNADDTHAGNWSCGLGVVGDAEIESIVPVTVTDSYIIPTQLNVSVASDLPKLTCRILPSKKEVIQYCRWMRPNGHGITERDSAQYVRHHSRNSCMLSISEWRSEDIGTWRCYARLGTSSDEEVFATMVVVAKHSQFEETIETSNIILNIFSICLLIVGLIGACIVGIIFYKRRMPRIDMTKNQLPPSYYNEYNSKDAKDINITVKKNPDI